MRREIAALNVTPSYFLLLLDGPLGTALIGVGAVLIGYFGAVQEPPHTLDELLALYSRPPFVAFATIFVLVFIGVLVLAHLAEWQLHVRLFRPYFPDTPRRKTARSASASGGGGGGKTKGKRAPAKARPTRRWSAPTLAPVVEVSESSSGIATPVLAIADEANRRGLPVERVLLNRSSASPKRSPNRKSYGTIARATDGGRAAPRAASPSAATTTTTAAQSDKSTSAAALLAAKYDPMVRRTCLGLSVAYGAASGTLSGACLLLAKSGVELLVLTIAGHNQFARWQSWALVGIMLIAALLQLWYLNKALRLADPTLVCPLAFCFYNTSSIALGLVYFNQLGALKATSLILVVLGTAILLAGVWIVSMHGEDPTATEDGADVLADPTEREALLTSNAAGITGPHLPPVSSPIGAENQQQPGSDSSSPTTSPQTPSLTSPPASPTSSRAFSPSQTSNGGSRGRRRRSRSGSGSGGYVGGLGLHVPGLSSTDAGPPYEVIASPTSMELPKGTNILSPSSTPDLERGAVNDAAAAAPSHPSSSSGMSRSQSDTGVLGGSRAALEQSAPPTSSALRRTRDMYRAVLERGLSIGISPSSPGFHLAASFAPDDEEEDDDDAFGEDEGDLESHGGEEGRRPRRERPTLIGAWKKFVRRGRQGVARGGHGSRRTVSEADVESRRHAREEEAERPSVLVEGQSIEEIEGEGEEQVETLMTDGAGDDVAVGDEEQRDQATPSSSSGWNMVLAVDYGALSERLSRLKNDAGGWFRRGGGGSGAGEAGGDASSGHGPSTLRSGEEEEEDGQETDGRRSSL